MTLTVLIVEDAPLVATTVQAVCRRAGWEARIAPSVAAARAVLDGWTPDCILMDRRLPDGDGSLLVREVRALVPDHVAIVMVSGDPLDQDTIGADAVMLKPVGARQVLDLVESAVRSRAPRPESPGRPASP